MLYACASDEPVISLHGAEEAKIGSAIQFNVDKKSAKPPGWSFNWPKNITCATEPIDISQKEDNGSNSRQLIIRCVSKKDEEKYHAFLSRESNGKIYKVFSNCILLLP